MRYLILTAIILNSFLSFGQRFTVTANKQNIFYRGIPNSMDVFVENCKCGSFVVYTNHGRVEHNNNCNYVYYADSLGKTLISVYKLKGNDSLFIGSYEFRVKDFPNPVAKIANKKSGQISKDLLLSQTGIKADLENFDISIKYDIISFNVIIIWNNDSISYKKIEGARLTEELKNEFKKLQIGNRVYFEDIIAKRPNNSTMTLNTIRFDIE